MKNLIILLAISLSSCYHYSEVKHETGYIIEKQFSPEFTAHASSVSSNGSYVATNIHNPEEYVLVFKCEHKIVFCIQSKELYYSLEKGDTVDISYRDEMNINESIIGIDFVTAVKK